jgi:hypothetical protein
MDRTAGKTHKSRYRVHHTIFSLKLPSPARRDRLNKRDETMDAADNAANAANVTNTANAINAAVAATAAHTVVAAAAAAAAATATAITDAIAASVANMQPPAPQVVQLQAPPAVLDYLNNPGDADAAMDTSAADYQDKSGDAKFFTDPTKHHAVRFVAYIDLTLEDNVPVITSHKVQNRKSRPARMSANCSAPKKQVNFYAYQTLGAARDALLKGRREKSRRAARNAQFALATVPTTDDDADEYLVE